ncbi:restriction endonuclease subunit S [Lactococcus cremoris]|jgi:type I restriction enzyme S subunit|uniref:restriction endonuclease subunit S n=1 Tax=Lactococcus lactis subsp. cremoris TaxID=1359 RepID=UPI0021AF4BB7|nr:restriction endonuclease subunit S [Lactococcus cremoris]MCI1842396.1 restriction endonuclease subunit S [Lactococcus lactis]MCT0509163.1 restriction endonuclease subunit S [Lactococcus cremoris]
MKERLKAPELRFDGFTDDWEERKLGDISKVIDPHPSHRAPAATEEGIPFIGIGDVNEGGNINYKTARIVDAKIFDEHHNRYDLSIPSIGIGRVASLGKVIRLRDDIGKYVVSPTMSVIQFTNNNDLDFLYSNMNTPIFQKQFKSFSNGSTRQSVGIQDLRILMVSLPVDIEEQQKIGAFFKQLDDTIALHQRKLDLLKEQKKGYLQKMFPKNGAKVPELRFAGFADDWEERKLGDEVRIVMGQSPNSENYTDDPNDYILVQGNADMKNGRVLPRVWTTQVTKQAEKDDLILSVRAPVGDIGKTAYDVVIGRGVAAIKGNEFIFQNLGKMKSDGYWTRYSTGSTFESINSTDIKEAIISVPAIEEQDKIGSFFKQLDETIALHQRKLDLLKEQKKGFLQKMFV